MHLTTATPLDPLRHYATVSERGSLGRARGKIIVSVAREAAERGAGKPLNRSRGILREVLMNLRREINETIGFLRH